MALETSSTGLGKLRDVAHVEEHGLEGHARVVLAPRRQKQNNPGAKKKVGAKKVNSRQYSTYKSCSIAVPNGTDKITHTQRNQYALYSCVSSQVTNTHINTVSTVNRYGMPYLYYAIHGQNREHE